MYCNTYNRASCRKKCTKLQGIALSNKDWLDYYSFINNICKEGPNTWILNQLTNIKIKYEFIKYSYITNKVLVNKNNISLQKALLNVSVQDI